MGFVSNTTIFRDRKGMALLITIMVVSLLLGVTVQFNRSVRQSFFSSAAQLEGQKLYAIARSGLVIGTALLEAEETEKEYDSLQDTWSELRPEDFADLFPQGEVLLQVTDLSGRLQINSLVAAQSAGEGENSGTKINNNREILNRLLLSGTFGVESEEEARAIIDALVDWLDPDDDESEFGAESGYYASLASPYSCRNGFITDVSELLLVKGITPRLLYGEAAGAGLADFITVHGRDGKININTAPIEVLWALNPLMTQELAEILDTYRRDEETSELLAEAGWYRNVPGFPSDIELPADVLSTKSSFFQIRSEGRLDEKGRSMTAVVERKTGKAATIVEKRVE